MRIQHDATTLLWFQTTQPSTPDSEGAGAAPDPERARRGEQAIALLREAGLSRPEHELCALYVAEAEAEADAEARQRAARQLCWLARELADRLWLRPQSLLPATLPASFWAGAIDRIGRQHGGNAIAIIAPQAVVAPALAALQRLGRARVDGHARAALVTLQWLRLQPSLDRLETFDRRPHDARTG